MAVASALAACGPSDTSIPTVVSEKEDEKAPAYRIRPLVSALSSKRSHAYAINDSGVIVGVWGDRPVRWVLDGSGGASPALPLQGEGDESERGEAIGVSESGSVVGWVGSDTVRPFLWDQDSGMRVLDLPDDLVGGVAYGVNDLGQIVGSGSVDPAFDDPRTGHVLLWTTDGEGAVPAVEDLGTFEGIGARGHAINAGGDIVGVVWEDAETKDGFLWARGQPLRQVPLESEILALNDRGDVVGVWDGRAALWSGGGVLPSARSVAWRTA